MTRRSRVPQQRAEYQPPWFVAAGSLPYWHSLARMGVLGGTWLKAYSTVRSPLVAAGINIEDFHERTTAGSAGTSQETAVP
jgi:hypothetical protein